AALLPELLHRGEDVDGEPFERAVHAGEAQHGVLVAGRFEQERRLAELADLRTHPLAELHRDLDVARLVPTLPGPFELERERSLIIVEVPARPARTLEGLDLADEDAVHQAACTFRRVEALGAQAAGTFVASDRGAARVGDTLLHPHAVEALVARQLVGVHV